MDTFLSARRDEKIQGRVGSATKVTIERGSREEALPLLYPPIITYLGQSQEVAALIKIPQVSISLEIYIG